MTASFRDHDLSVEPSHTQGVFGKSDTVPDARPPTAARDRIDDDPDIHANAQLYQEPVS